MALLDPISFFSQTLIPSGGAGAARRVPFTFTSTKRLITANGTSGPLISRDLVQQNAQQTLKDELQAIQNSSTISTLTGTLGMSSATTLSTSPVISMMVNPHTVKWSQPKRYTKKDTMNGSVFFHFSNTNGQNNDILTLTFSGNTGNISTQQPLDYQYLTSTGPAAVALTGADNKLRMWHELYSLTREEVLLPKAIKNEFFITYRTVLMPISITFVGFFNSTLEFTETAASPFSRDYSFSFTVLDTSPKLDVLVSKINSALSTTGLIGAGIQAVGAVNSIINTVKLGA